MNRLVTGVGLLTLFVLAAGARAERPRVVTSTVEDGQDDVDPALTEIRVEFDQRMDRRSWSVVGVQAFDLILDGERERTGRTDLPGMSILTTPPDAAPWRRKNE